MRSSTLKHFYCRTVDADGFNWRSKLSGVVKSQRLCNRAQLESSDWLPFSVRVRDGRWSIINILIAYQQLGKRYSAISPLEIRAIEYMYWPNPRDGENCSHSEKWRHECPGSRTKIPMMTIPTSKAGICSIHSVDGEAVVGHCASMVLGKILVAGSDITDSVFDSATKYIPKKNRYHSEASMMFLVSCSYRHLWIHV